MMNFEGLVSFCFMSIVLGCLVGWGAYQVLNYKTLTKIEVLEKTCRTVID